MQCMERMKKETENQGLPLAFGLQFFSAKVHSSGSKSETGFEWHYLLTSPISEGFCRRLAWYFSREKIAFLPFYL